MDTGTTEMDRILTESFIKALKEVTNITDLMIVEKTQPIESKDESTSSTVGN